MVAGMTALSEIYPVYEAEFEKKAVVVSGGAKNAKRAFSDKLVHDSRWKGLLDNSRKEAARRAKSGMPGSRAAGRAIGSAANRGVPLGGAAAALRGTPAFRGAMAESDKIALATKGGMGDVGALGASTVARGGAGTPGARLEGAVRDPVGTVKGAVGGAKKKLKARRKRRAQKRALSEVRNATGKKHLSPDEYGEFVTTGGVKRIQPDPSAVRAAEQGRVRGFDNPYGVKKSDVWHWQGPNGDDAGERRWSRKETWPAKGKQSKRKVKRLKSGDAVEKAESRNRAKHRFTHRQRANMQAAGAGGLGAAGVYAALAGGASAAAADHDLKVLRAAGADMSDDYVKLLGKLKSAGGKTAVAGGGLGLASMALANKSGKTREKARKQERRSR